MLTDFIEQLELIQAKVPILKFHDSIQNLEVDLNCNNAVGIRNTHLLYCYSRSKMILINNKRNILIMIIYFTQLFFRIFYS